MTTIGDIMRKKNILKKASGLMGRKVSMDELEELAFEEMDRLEDKINSGSGTSKDRKNWYAWRDILDLI